MGAGFLLDEARLLRDLAHGFDPHPALVALLGGDPLPIRAELNAHYALHTDFVLALTAARELVVRPELRFRPLGEGALSSGLPLQARRMDKEEVGQLLACACDL